jgi:hypothetical protein
MNYEEFIEQSRACQNELGYNSWEITYPCKATKEQCIKDTQTLWKNVNKADPNKPIFFNWFNDNEQSQDIGICEKFNSGGDERSWRPLYYNTLIDSDNSLGSNYMIMDYQRRSRANTSGTNLILSKEHRGPRGGVGDVSIHAASKSRFWRVTKNNTEIVSGMINDRLPITTAVTNTPSTPTEKTYKYGTKQCGTGYRQLNQNECPNSSPNVIADDSVPSGCIKIKYVSQSEAYNYGITSSLNGKVVWNIGMPDTPDDLKSHPLYAPVCKKLTTIKKPTTTTTPKTTPTPKGCFVKFSSICKKQVDQEMVGLGWTMTTPWGEKSRTSVWNRDITAEKQPPTSFRQRAEGQRRAGCVYPDEIDFRKNELALHCGIEKKYIDIKQFPLNNIPTPPPTKNTLPPPPTTTPKTTPTPKGCFVKFSSICKKQMEGGGTPWGEKSRKSVWNRDITAEKPPPTSGRQRADGAGCVYPDEIDIRKNELALHCGIEKKYIDIKQFPLNNIPTPPPTKNTLPPPPTTTTTTTPPPSFMSRFGSGCYSYVENCPTTWYGKRYNKKWSRVPGYLEENMEYKRHDKVYDSDIYKEDCTGHRANLILEECKNTGSKNVKVHNMFVDPVDAPNFFTRTPFSIEGKDYIFDWKSDTKKMIIPHGCWINKKGCEEAKNLKSLWKPYNISTYWEKGASREEITQGMERSPSGLIEGEWGIAKGSSYDIKHESDCKQFAEDISNQAICRYKGIVNKPAKVKSYWVPRYTIWEDIKPVLKKSSVAGTKCANINMVREAYDCKDPEGIITSKPEILKDNPSYPDGCFIDTWGGGPKNPRRLIFNKFGNINKNRNASNGIPVCFNRDFDLVELYAGAKCDNKHMVREANNCKDPKGIITSKPGILTDNPSYPAGCFIDKWGGGPKNPRRLIFNKKGSQPKNYSDRIDSFQSVCFKKDMVPW